MHPFAKYAQMFPWQADQRTADFGFVPRHPITRIWKYQGEPADVMEAVLRALDTGVPIDFSRPIRVNWWDASEEDLRAEYERRWPTAAEGCRVILHLGPAQTAESWKLRWALEEDEPIE